MKFNKTYEKTSGRRAMKSGMGARKYAGFWAAMTLAGNSLLLLPSLAFARPTGEPQGCGNCHYKSQGPEITIGFSKEKPDPGETITVEVKLKAVHSQAQKTGIMLTTDEQGKFALMDMTGTRLDGEFRVLHAQPKSLDSNKEASFNFRWTAPSSPGVANFTANSMTSVPPDSTGKLLPEEFHSSQEKASIAFGCDAILYYPDGDSDGFGDEKNAQLSCEPIENYITKGGDCDDAKDAINPDAEEICDSVDNNCDGETDEGLEPGLYYKDADGDGWAPKSGGTPVFGCNDKEGFAMKRGDCDDKNDKINPDAEEICDGKDNNCSGEVDDVDGDDCKGSGGQGGKDEEAVGGCTVGHRAPVGPFPIALGLALSGVVLGRITRRRRR